MTASSLLAFRCYFEVPSINKDFTSLHFTWAQNLHPTLSNNNELTGWSFERVQIVHQQFSGKHHFVAPRWRDHHQTGRSVKSKHMNTPARWPWRNIFDKIASLSPKWWPKWYNFGLICISTSGVCEIALLIKSEGSTKFWQLRIV